MPIEKRQKETVYNICTDIINGKIKTLDELYKVWPKEFFKESFFYDIFNALTEYFVGVDINKGKVNENSWEFLDTYTAFKVLEYDKDFDKLYKAYKSTLKIKNLTKDRVDENLKKVLG